MINEIMITEKYYVRDLETVVKLFILPLRKGGVLPAERQEEIFANWELLLRVNTEIRDSLMQDFEAAGDIQLMNVGRTFISMVPSLRIYSIYAAHQKDSMQILEDLRVANKQFGQLLTEAEAKPDCKGVNLLGFLIKPIQRICKYPLLFRVRSHAKTLHTLSPCTYLTTHATRCAGTVAVHARVAL